MFTSGQHWANRIGAVVFGSLMSLFGVSLAVQSGVVPSTQFLPLVMMYAAILLVIVLEERRQPFGSTMTIGILPTRQTLPMILRGALWSTTLLAVIAATVLIVGGSFNGGSFECDPLTAIGVIIAAIGEELLFRTTVMRVLNDRFGAAVGIILTSAVFALAHTGNPGASNLSNVNTFLIGLALGIVVTQGGSIWLAASFHGTWNTTVALFFGTVSGNELGIRWLTIDLPQHSTWLSLIVGDNYGIESGLATTILIIISLAILRHIVLVDPFVIAARLRSSIQMKAFQTMRT